MATNPFEYFKLSEIAWGIYEKMRQSAVALGYYPDTKANTFTPDQLKTEIENIRAGGVLPVQIVDLKPQKRRGAVEYGRIFIEMPTIEQGSVASSGGRDYINETATEFTRVEYADETKNVNFVLSLIPKTIENLDQMIQVLDQTVGIGDLVSMPGFDTITEQFTEKEFEIKWQNQEDISQYDFFEIKVFYKVMDVYLTAPKTTQVSIIQEYEQELIFN